MDTSRMTLENAQKMLDDVFGLAPKKDKWANVTKPTNGRGTEVHKARMDRLYDVRVQQLARKLERAHATPAERDELRRIRRSDRRRALVANRRLNKREASYLQTGWYP